MARVEQITVQMNGSEMKNIKSKMKLRLIPRDDNNSLLVLLMAKNVAISHLVFGSWSLGSGSEIGV